MNLRNDPLSHDRAPSHRKIAWPRAAEIAQRLEAGETLAQIADSCGRGVATLRTHLNDHGYDSATALPLVTTRPREVVEAPPVRPWIDGAPCAQTDPEVFFPENGGSVRQAKQVCLGCDVKAECLEWALTTDERFGVFGGLSPKQRRQVKQERAS